MSWGEQAAKTANARRVAANAQTDLGPVDEQTPFGGFFSSALSGFTELFGQSPTPEAEEFRAKNPGAGLVSEILPTLIPYAGWAKATEAPRLAGMLERTVARVVPSALERPIAYNAVKEMARFAPLELTRLGVGLATAPQENWGNLFADVGLSVALTGAGGSVLGMLKAGGKLAPELGEVAGADIGLKPSFALRLGMEDGAAVTKGAALDDVNLRNFQEALAYKPGKPSEYVAPLEGASPKADVEIQKLFRAQSENLDALPQIDKRTLEIGKGPKDTRRLTQDMQDFVVEAAGFKTIQELAATVDTPRLLTVRSQRAAGAFGKMLEDNDALQFVGDGTLLAREKDGGLFVFAKRLRSGEAEAGAKPFGTSKIAEGDQWLIGKTDQPQRLVPEAHKVADAVISRWAKLAEAYRPVRNDPFNASMDQALEYLTPQDYRDLVSTRAGKRAGAIASISERITKSITGSLDIQDSTNARRIAEGLADVFKPTMFKEASNPVYGRFNGLLKDVTRVADRATAERMEETATLVSSLTDEEANLVGRANATQTPAEDLAKLSATGVVSQRATEVVARLQEMNKQFLAEYVIPGLKSAGMEGKFEALEGYIAPRVYRGDWFVEVKDAGGRLQYLANGKSAGAAKAEAAAIVEEAASRGKSWVASEEDLRHAVEWGADDVGKISDMVRERIAADGTAHEIVQSAMRRLDAAQAGAARPMGTKRAMGAFRDRTGVAGSPDAYTYTKADLISGIEKHYRQLGRFVGVHAWRERWMPEVLGLEKMSPKLYEDLLRKTNQIMGVPGELTKVQDQALSKVLGGVAGSKPATKIAQWTNGAMHAWTIGLLNPTFAVQNLLSVVQTVAPQIAYLTRLPEEGMMKMMQTMPRFGPDGLPRGTLSTLHPMKVLGQALKMLRSDEPWVKEMYEAAKKDGTIAAHRQDDWIGGYSKNAQTLKQTWERGGGWEMIKKISFLMADKSEEFSRMIAFNSGALLGKNGFGFEGDQLYRFARRFVETTMYSYSVVDRPRIMTGPIGSMFGLFKNWQFHFIGSMAEYAGVGMREGVWGPMLWQGASALALGGLGATPLAMLANGLARWESGDSTQTGYRWLQENWHDAADEVYFGLPAFLGVSLQNSSALPGTDVYRDTSSLMNIAVVTKAMQMGKAIGAAWDYGTKADDNPFANTQVRDSLATALLPRAFDKLYAGLEGDYIRSTTGTVLERDVSPTARMLTAMGMNTLEVERNAVAARELQADADRTKAVVSALGLRYMDAQVAQDWPEMQRVIDRALMLNVPVSSVMNSARARVKREEGDRFQKFDAAKVQKYREALGE